MIKMWKHEELELKSFDNAKRMRGKIKLELIVKNDKDEINGFILAMIKVKDTWVGMLGEKMVRAGNEEWGRHKSH